MPLDGNDFFQLVLKACLQLENNDPQRDMTEVREPVWTHLRHTLQLFCRVCKDITAEINRNAEEHNF